MQSVKGRGKRNLHSTPPEFAEAAEHKNEQQRLLACRYLPDIAAEEARRERIRNMKMPAHRPKSVAKVLYYEKGRPVYESPEETRARIWRLAHRRAHKKFI